MRLPIVALLLVSSAASAAEPVGRVKTVAHPAWIVRDGARVEARVGEPVFEKDAVETGAGGRIGITLTDHTTLSTGPSSRLDLESYRFDSAALKGNLLANMKRGTLAVSSGDIARSGADAMKVKTPRAVLGVRGTEFLVRVTEP